jgi:hypothetical protein
MQVILHTDFVCAPEGHTTLRFKAGDVVTGKVAELALAADAGFNPVEETKPAAPLETKAPLRAQPSRRGKRK